jgi:hypothetical protein
MHLVQSKLWRFLLSKLIDLIKQYYFYGGASQYKNKKNFVNLCYDKDDFGMDAERRLL